MSANVRPIPADRPRLGPYITVDDGAAAIAFYRRLVDPFGHRWWIASRVEEVSEEEMMRRAKEMHGVS